MRTSELFRKKILETYVGGITNKFRIKKRRDCLFFGDVFINYIKECESSGYGKEMEETGRKWMFLYFSQLVPDAIRKLPLPILSRLMKRVWINLGLMKDFSIRERDGLIEITTRGEAITDMIGKNRFSIGLFLGICNVLFSSGIDFVSVSRGNESRYVFRKNGRQDFGFEGKSKKKYNKLNFTEPLKGFSLDDAFRTNMFHLRENMIYFRGKTVYTVENTLFHIVGESGIITNRISEISFDFFRDIVDMEASDSRKLGLLKTILQTMGWGIVNIVLKNDRAAFRIRNPPFGLQKDNDNWTFLSNAILGYLWMIDRGFRLESTSISERMLEIIYSKH